MITFSTIWALTHNSHLLVVFTTSPLIKISHYYLINQLTPFCITHFLASPWSKNCLKITRTVIKRWVSIWFYGIIPIWFSLFCCSFPVPLAFSLQMMKWARLKVKPLLFQASGTLRLGSGPLICATSEVCEPIGSDPFFILIVICFVAVFSCSWSTILCNFNGLQLDFNVKVNLLENNLSLHAFPWSYLVA